MADAGVTEWALTRLGDVARNAGYIPSGAPDPVEATRNFAYMAVLECRDVARGRLTWPQSYQRAVDTGASVKDALVMTQHLQHVFCPDVH